MNLVKNPLAVIDTNIWISGIYWKGIPSRVINLVKTRNIIPTFSYDTYGELITVNTRFSITLHRVGEGQLELKFAKENGAFFEPHTQISRSRDPHDDMFLEICVASHADYLITGDEDLLSLKTIESTKIITPKQFLGLVR
jgi:putative PIN family toxin of toxin-antitoxin system